MGAIAHIRQNNKWALHDILLVDMEERNIGRTTFCLAPCWPSVPVHLPDLLLLYLEQRGCVCSKFNVHGHSQSTFFWLHFIFQCIHCLRVATFVYWRTAADRQLARCIWRCSVTQCVVLAIGQSTKLANDKATSLGATLRQLIATWEIIGGKLYTFQLSFLFGCRVYLVLCFFSLSLSVHFLASHCLSFE